MTLPGSEEATDSEVCKKVSVRLLISVCVSTCFAGLTVADVVMPWYVRRQVILALIAHIFVSEPVLFAQVRVHYWDICGLGFHVNAEKGSWTPATAAQNHLAHGCPHDTRLLLRQPLKWRIT